MGAGLSRALSSKDYLSIYLYTGGWVELLAIAQTLHVHYQAQEQRKPYLRSHMLVLLFLATVRFHFVNHPSPSLHRLVFWIHLWEFFAFGMETFTFAADRPWGLMLPITGQAIWILREFRKRHPQLRLGGWTGVP